MSNRPGKGASIDAGREPGGVQSVEVGMRVLKALADAGGEQTIGRIAEATGMPAAKAHRYLVSLQRAGFVERDVKSGRYVLGPEALRVGLTALGRVDVIEAASDELQRLRDHIPGSMLLAVWSQTGPTIVRWVEARRPVTVNVRPGSKMPLLRSATGQVFAAYLPKKIVSPLMEAELEDLRQLGLALPSNAQIESRLASVRETGLGHTAGEMLPGVVALAAPLFNHDQELAGVIAVLGLAGHFDDSLTGPNAVNLRRAAHEISRRLGARVAARTR
jgi:DNA-binding IclR family transcriptional regulator